LPAGVRIPSMTTFFALLMMDLGPLPALRFIGNFYELFWTCIVGEG
jgi:hypothetical protein